MKIGIDLDNVLNENAQSIIDYAYFMFGVTDVSLKDFTQYHVYKVTPIKKEMLDEMFNNPYYFYTIPPYLKMIKLVNRLYSDGNYISIVTDRPESCYNATLGWLSKWEVFYDSVYICSAKDKPLLAKDRGLEFFIEDRLDTAIALSEVCKTVYLLDAPWNQSLLPSNVDRFKKNTNYEENRIYREISNYGKKEIL